MIMAKSKAMILQNAVMFTQASSERTLFSQMLGLVLGNLEESGSQDIAKNVRHIGQIWLSAVGLDQFNDRLYHLTEGWTIELCEGLISPHIYFKSLSQKILMIEQSMRQEDELFFCNKPDLFHEIIGHVPLLLNPEARDCLLKYANVGQLTTSNQSDDMYFNHFRQLIHNRHSNIGFESPNLIQVPSELVSTSIQLTRLGWWSFEMGMIGTGSQTKPFGAALISSLREYKFCQSKPVLDFSVECMNVDFDPTTMQDKYFRIKSFQVLYDVLDQFQGIISNSKILSER